VKRLIVLQICFLFALHVYCQDVDTIPTYQVGCDSPNPHAIDTSYFYWDADTLVIRTVGYGSCCPNLLGLMHQTSDTIEVWAIDTTYIMCLCDCSLGYSFRIPIESDSIYVSSNGSYVLVTKLLNAIQEHHKWDEKDVLVFPNPIEDIFNVTMPNWMQAKVSIQDIQGFTVYESNELINAISLNDLHFSSGIYVLRIHSNENEIRKLVVKK
jgi:hypothetical protein